MEWRCKIVMIFLSGYFFLVSFASPDNQKTKETNNFTHDTTVEYHSEIKKFIRSYFDDFGNNRLEEGWSYYKNNYGIYYHERYRRLGSDISYYCYIIDPEYKILNIEEKEGEFIVSVEYIVIGFFGHQDKYIMDDETNEQIMKREYIADLFIDYPTKKIRYFTLVRNNNDYLIIDEIDNSIDFAFPIPALKWLEKKSSENPNYLELHNKLREKLT